MDWVRFMVNSSKVFNTSCGQGCGDNAVARRSVDDRGVKLCEVSGPT
ncbi:MAG TPA: hypothetical protein VIY30_03095 [Burkholderiaceae bacterium]